MYITKAACTKTPSLIPGLSPKRTTSIISLSFSLQSPGVTRSINQLIPVSRPNYCEFTTSFPRRNQICETRATLGKESLFLFSAHHLRTGVYSLRTQCAPRQRAVIYILRHILQFDSPTLDLCQSWISCTEPPVSYLSNHSKIAVHFSRGDIGLSGSSFAPLVDAFTVELNDPGISTSQGFSSWRRCSINT
ncbi:uncharacterized protein BDV17DRAFT_9547 [Aspergillus undulatus]|uniref:uncharacterized protein n=1 Tax=Aspergillus undulatus TaxID=1810928 RepID=UPI003CCC9F88